MITEKRRQQLRVCNRRYYKKHNISIKEQKLKLMYNIDREQLKQMFIAQEGKCAICDFQFTTRKSIHIDHNHKIGKVRQLLCPNCNTGLGKFKEEISLLLKAINYLNKWNEDIDDRI